VHTAARDYVARQVEAFGPFASVVEIGSRDINGGVRDLFGDARYVGLDLHPGPGVDWHGDASRYHPPEPVECVVCCEVLEHTPAWSTLMARAFAWLEARGVLIVTCAGPGRRQHSAIDGGWSLHRGEHYANVEADHLARVLRLVGFPVVTTSTAGRDTRAVAVKA
jgi:hypothetical protein